MIKIYQQNFIPASRGLIKSAPSSLIPDGSFQETVNVRFGDGYVEKVKAFIKFAEVPEKVIGIRIYKKNDGTSLNMVHTIHGLYSINEQSVSHDNLISGDYEVPTVGHVSSVNAFDQYFFTSLGTNIYYWESSESNAKILEGTYSPSKWNANHSYEVGDVVKPTNQNYSGYIYKCTRAGTSDSSEPTWQQDLSTPITDNTVRWVGVGSLELEGSSASTLRA